ncbi:28 kDa heat-and acid-stable phosphoprotein, partial [Nibea albiflora]
VPGKKGHKGRGKQFSNPEEIDRQMKAQRELEANAGAEKGSSSESEEESSSEDESESRKRSGVEGLIEIENPNRVSQKSKKVTEVDVTAPRELSRRERKRCRRSQRKALVLHLNASTCTSVSGGWQEKGDLEEVEMEEEENGEGTNSSGIRSGVLLNSCPSFQIRGAWVFHGSVVRTGKTGGAKREEEECNIWDASSFL